MSLVCDMHEIIIKKGSSLCFFPNQVVNNVSQDKSLTHKDEGNKTEYLARSLPTGETSSLILLGRLFKFTF